MANSLAITSVTTALCNLLTKRVQELDATLGSFSVTAATPDNARKNVTGSSLNVFLYRTVVNPAWHNHSPSPTPSTNRGAPTRLAPLPLNLHYLITAYSPDEVAQETKNHRVLGAAMSALHDQALLSVADLSAVAGSDLAEQVERIRITPLPLSLDDMSKLWSAVQTQYRISAAYEVGVVLIDSSHGPRTPLPVLRRGADDAGVVASTGAVPALYELRAPRRRRAAMLGDDVVVIAEALTPADTTVRFRSTTTTGDGAPALAPVDLVPIAGASPGESVVTIADLASDPDALGRWAPGHYVVSVVLARAGSPTVTGNDIGYDLAPTITVSPNSTAAAQVHVGDSLTITCAPRILDRQRVRILFGSADVEPATIVNPDPTSPTFRTTPTTLTCVVPDAAAGRYLVRLRVDDVDSIPLADGTPPAFDPRHQVVIT